LRAAGIITWRQLSKATPERLKEILTDAGPRFKMHNPQSWPEQAAFAANYEWRTLIEFQQVLDGGKDGADTLSDSKLEKLLIKKGKIKATPAAPKAAKEVKADEITTDPVYGLKSDNLQLVEGIGPKINGLLNDAGIVTWRQLSQASSEQLRKILTDAGPRYKMHNPDSWPEQAGFAANGEWDALISFQKVLDGGKDNKGGGTSDSKLEKLLIKKGKR